MSRRFRNFRQFAIGFILAVAAANTASAAPDPNDPYEDGNRRRFRSHVALHRYIIDPVESVYVEIVPEPLRRGLHNVLTNIDTPSVFANNLFQGRPGAAGNTLARFVINSTAGVGGIFDLATRAGIPYRDNDFGRTLAVYGVGDYPYLMIPVIGSSNPRDFAGKIVDFALNPLRYTTLPGGIWTSLGLAGANELDKRSYDVGALVELDRTAPDPYAADRDMAREQRNRELDLGQDPP